MMTDEEVAELIEKEFREKSRGDTEQYLAICQPILKNGRPKIDRFDREKSSDEIIAYLPVESQPFAFAVYIDTTRREIYIVGIESRNTLALRVTSETLTAAELQAFINLKAGRFYNKGDLRPSKKSVRPFSFVGYEPNPEPDEFEDKIKKLLILLKDHRDEILKLKAQANAFISATIDFHVGNQLLGGAKLDLECIKIMNDLNLGLVFDFNAWGESFQ